MVLARARASPTACNEAAKVCRTRAFALESHLSIFLVEAHCFSCYGADHRSLAHARAPLPCAHLADKRRTSRARLIRPFLLVVSVVGGTSDGGDFAFARYGDDDAAAGKCRSAFGARAHVRARAHPISQSRRFAR